MRPLPVQYVRPSVRRNKTDRTDAEGMLEAHRCAGIRPVPVKTCEQQALQALHRVRTQWQATRTNRINVLRGLLREQGYPVPVGARTVLTRVMGLLEDPARVLPASLRALGLALVEEVRTLEARVAALDQQLVQVAHEDPVATRLQQIPAVGVVTAPALVGAVLAYSRLSPRTGLRELAGPHAARVDHGHPSLSGPQEQTGRRLSPLSPDPWRPRRPARRAADRQRATTPAHPPAALGDSLGRSTRPQQGGDRARQQVGPHHLGRLVSGDRFSFARGPGRVRRHDSPDEMVSER